MTVEFVRGKNPRCAGRKHPHYSLVCNGDAGCPACDWRGATKPQPQPSSGRYTLRRDEGYADVIERDGLAAMVLMETPANIANAQSIVDALNRETTGTSKEATFNEAAAAVDHYANKWLATRSDYVVVIEALRTAAGILRGLAVASRYDKSAPQPETMAGEVEKVIDADVARRERLELLNLTATFYEHPEGYEGPCLCAECCETSGPRPPRDRETRIAAMCQRLVRTSPRLQLANLRASLAEDATEHAKRVVKKLRSRVATMRAEAATLRREGEKLRTAATRYLVATTTHTDACRTRYELPNLCACRRDVFLPCGWADTDDLRAALSPSPSEGTKP